MIYLPEPFKGWQLASNRAYAAVTSGFIALVMAGLSSISKVMDYVVRGVIDAMLALPHLYTIIDLFTLGGGKMGVIWAVALTHWPKLALILRSELQRVSQSDYIMLSQRIGNSAFIAGVITIYR